MRTNQWPPAQHVCVPKGGSGYQATGIVNSASARASGYKTANERRCGEAGFLLGLDLIFFKITFLHRYGFWYLWFSLFLYSFMDETQPSVWGCLELHTHTHTHTPMYSFSKAAAATKQQGLSAQNQQELAAMQQQMKVAIRVGVCVDVKVACVKISAWD